MWHGSPSFHTKRPAREFLEIHNRAHSGKHKARSGVYHPSILCVPFFLTLHTHTHPFNGPFPGLPRWASTRKVKPIWILQKQETVSGSDISGTTYKSAPRSRQITMPAPTTQFFTGWVPFLLPNQQRQSNEGTFFSNNNLLIINQQSTVLKHRKKTQNADHTGPIFVIPDWHTKKRVYGVATSRQLQYPWYW